MATYFIRIDTYWQNSADRFVGPFTSKALAEEEMQRALAAKNNVWSARSLCGGNIKYAIRVYPDVLTATEAKRMGMRPLGALRGTNMIGERVPDSTDDLYEIEEETAKLESF